MAEHMETEHGEHGSGDYPGMPAAEAMEEHKEPNYLAILASWRFSP